MARNTPTTDPRVKSIDKVRRYAQARDGLTKELAATVAELEAAMAEAVNVGATHAEVARAAGLHRSRITQIMGKR